MALQAAFRALHPDRGASAIEYAIMVAFIALAVIGAVALLGNNLTNFFDNSATQLSTP